MIVFKESLLIAKIISFKIINNKNMKIESIVFVLLVFFSSLAVAQVDVKKVIPPSPNAVALAKFADQPVNIHTGIPKVNIPLYDWNNSVSALSLNVSLDYHAGGIKVEEQSSNVGLGWALNAGGVVTRTMRGRPDELPLGFLTTSQLPDISTSTYDGSFLRVNQYYNNYYAITATNSGSFDSLYNITHNYYDGQQDVFMFSFNGRSGKFFIGKDGSIVTQNKENIKLVMNQTPGLNKINSFDIIDEQGILYHFSEIETTQITTQGNGSSPSVNDLPYDSSWYLSYISSADRQSTINFTYQSSQQNYRAGYSETKGVDLGFWLNATLPFEELSSSYNEVEVIGKRLSQISLPDGIDINFTYANAERLDIDNDYALNKVSISDGQHSFGFDFIQSFIFSGGSSYNYNNVRMQLDRVDCFGDNLQEKPYRFFYHNPLPAKDSFNQDFWGYAIGGERFMNTRIPKMDVPTAEGQIAHKLNYIIDGADRSPDPVAVKSASLRSIIYPTGGSTIFDMEINQSFGQFYKQDRMVKSFGFSKSGANQLYAMEVVATANLAIDIKINVQETSRITPEPGTPIWYLEDDIDNNPVNIVMTKGGWSTVLYSGTYGQIRQLPYLLVDDLIVPEIGTYSIEMQMNTSYPIDFYAFFTAVYGIAPTNKPVGGIRIKQIKSYEGADETTALLLNKNYSYNLTDGRSSGNISTVPNYNYYNITKLASDEAGPGWNGNYHDMLTRSSNSSQPLGFVQGSPIGYTQVTVEQLDGLAAIGGKTVFEFTPLQIMDSYDILPFKQGEYISWGAGMLLSEKSYNDQGQPVRSVINTYTTTAEKKISANHRSLVASTALQDLIGNTSPLAGYVVQQSYPILGNTLKKRQIERNYTGAEYLEEITDYIYDDKFQQKTVTKRNSIGKQTSIYFYPYDFMGLSPFYQMVNANRIGNIVKGEQWKVSGADSVLVASDATSFASDRDPLGFVRPSATYKLLSARGLTLSEVNAHNSSQFLPANGYLFKELEYFNYLSNGALRSYGRPNGIKSSFHWNVNGMLVAGTATNADATEVFLEDFEVSGNSTANYHTGKKGFSGSYTPPFNLPNGRPFLVNYWNFNGTTWSYVTAPYTGQTLVGIIDDVRIAPADAEVTTFINSPYAGIKSQIDAKGQTIYFDYDEFKRLNQVKDQNGNLIKTYTYHNRN